MDTQQGSYKLLENQIMGAGSLTNPTTLSPIRSLIAHINEIISQSNNNIETLERRLEMVRHMGTKTKTEPLEQPSDKIISCELEGELNAIVNRLQNMTNRLMELNKEIKL